MIRAAEPGDIPALADLAQRTWADAFASSVSQEDAVSDLEHRSESFFRRTWDMRTTLVAERGGALVGYVQFGDVEIPEVDVQPGDQELYRLYVETSLQGSGIGRALMDAALADPRLANAKRIFLQVWERNERAVRLYESLGFEIVGSTAFQIGDERVEDLVMARPSCASRS